MAEAGASLAQAKKDLEAAQNDVTRCMAELEAAQASAKPELSTRSLKVTLLEVFEGISVDRVAVRSGEQSQQEKVVAEGIPSTFTIEAGVQEFDVVFMAEHSPPAPTSDNAVGATTVSDPGVLSNGMEQSAGEVSKVEAGSERQEEGAGVTEESKLGVKDAGGLKEAEDEAQEMGGDEVIVEASDATPAASTMTVPSSDGVGAPAQEDGGSLPAGTPDSLGASPAATEVTEATEAAAATPAVGAIAEKDGKHDVEHVVDVGNAPVKEILGNGKAVPALPNPTGVIDSPGEAIDTANVVSGCSTITTEVIVPSSELVYDTPEGQWRYLGADSAPVAADETGPVEVSTGVRFSTSIKIEDDRDVDSRIVQLSSEYDAAELRLKEAEALVEQLTPATATPSERRPGNARKITSKKAAKRKHDQSRGAGGSRVRGPLSALSSGLSKAYSNVGKPVATILWGVRNMVFFASAVAVMHYRGEYLSV